MDAKDLFDNFDEFDDIEIDDESTEEAEDVTEAIDDTETKAETAGSATSDSSGLDDSLFDAFDFDDEEEEDATDTEEQSGAEDNNFVLEPSDGLLGSTADIFDNDDLDINETESGTEEAETDMSGTAFDFGTTEEAETTGTDFDFGITEENNNTTVNNELSDADIISAAFGSDTFTGTNTEEQQTLSTDGGILGELNAEGEWLTEATLEDQSASETILSDTVDKNSFEGMFLFANTPKSKTNASILEAGAVSSDAFTFDYLSIQNIIVWSPRIRKNTDVESLVTSIKNDGLINPIVVAPTKTEGRYVLIKGARRLLACAKLGMKTIPCVINNQATISDIHVIEPLYSHSKPYTVSDMIDYIEYLKKEKNITAPSMIEYLLNMESGDFVKLQDLRDFNDEDIMSQLLTGQLTISAAFKKLEQLRKKMGRDKMENARAEKIYGDATYGTGVLAESGEMGSNDSGLSEDEVKSMIDGMGSLEDVSDINGEELRQQGDSIQGYQPHKQDPENRERLDPKLRKAVLARDNNTCQICGMGGQEYGEVLDIHHAVEVYLGGTDQVDNLITACTCCHKLIHLWGRGELQVRPFDQMDEAEATKFKRIIKLGNVIRQGMAAKGMKKEQLKKLDQADTIGRRLKGSSDQVAG